MSTCKRTMALTIRHLKEIVRDPLSLVFLYGFPLVMEVLFYYLFSGQTGQFAMVFLAPAMVGFANAFLALFLGILMAHDRASAFMVRLYTTEVRPHEYILSYVLAILPLGLAQSAMLLVVGGLCDATFWSAYMPLALLVSVPTSLLFVAVGLLLGTVCNEKSVGGVSSIVVTGQSVLSGMWFPLEGMSKGFVTFLRVLPFKNVSSALQNVFLDCTLAGVGKPLLVVLAYCVGVTALALVLFRKQMKD